MPLWGEGGDGPISGQCTPPDTLTHWHYAPFSMAEDFDPEAMIQRFQERAQAVKSRPLPPVAGPDKKRFLERAQTDFMDFAMIGDAKATLEDGILTLRVDLRKS